MTGSENIAPVNATAASANASILTDAGKPDHEVKWQPSAQEAFHDNSNLCKYMTGQVISRVKIAIHSSKLSSGSGLFIQESLPAGREIYRSEPLFVCVEGGINSICHHCLKDAKGEIHSTGRIREPGEEAQAKLCMNCKVARFCSKVSIK